MTKHNLTPGQLIAQATAFDPETGCWNWVGTIDLDGYGRLECDYRQWRAHRFAYTHYVGAIPVGLALDHLCSNRRCVSPWHLEPVTQAENLRRAWRRRKAVAA